MENMENQKNISENKTKKDEEALLLPQKEKNKMNCISITCWIFQIIIWIGAISLCYIDIYEEKTSYYSGKRKYTTVSFILIITFESMFYVVYVILQFCSPTFYYLLHKRTDIKLCDKLKQLFTTPPKIQFVCECYHYETRTIYSKTMKWQ